MIGNFCVFIFLGCICLCHANDEEPNIRELLQNFPQNQNLVKHLGTRYEIVYPKQLRPDWVHGLSTIHSKVNDTIIHLSQTTFIIDTFQHKLHLDLELNTNLFAPTLVQFLHLLDSHMIISKLPENCYYHATIRNYPKSTAAFRTCEGLSGVIYLKDTVLIIYPLHGNHFSNHPHLLYHYFPEKQFSCDSELTNKISTKDNLIYFEEDIFSRHKYIELGLILDQSLFEKDYSSPTDVITSAIQIVNCADLIFHSLNTSISLVYIELWIEDQIKFDYDMETTLKNFHQYTSNKLNRISLDAFHLLSGFEFDTQKNGIAFPDSICTMKAVGLTHIWHPFQTHLSSYTLAHMIGHNLGMDHDHKGCICSNDMDCLMGNNIKFLETHSFSNCSIRDYHMALNKGYGTCLLNMPILRKSICGNGILEKDEEECDCGTTDECMKIDSCCDPITCKLIKHAQCSTGSCCKKCKLLSPDHLCRPSKGECDIPEFCDGIHGECPTDLYKKNGFICSGGLGYCYLGQCPVMKTQCQAVWGKDADSANKICFEQLNILGIPNGNCGSDAMGGIAKCAIENSYCGTLQCSQGEKVPLSSEKPVEYVINKINFQGEIHECKAKSSFLSLEDLTRGLVKDGTKCGYQKLCINQTCARVDTIITGNCPSKDIRMPCSGHGICTNINTCYCDEGWTGIDCNEIDISNQMKSTDEYYDSIEDTNSPSYGQNRLKVNANLAIIVIAACIVIGLGLVTTVVLILLYSKNMLRRRSHKNYRYK